jgi:hypothetical protein
VLEEFEAIAQAKFENGRGWDIWNGLARMFGMARYDIGDISHEVEKVVLRLKDTGLPAKCHLCERTDGWTLEGERWVCEHTNDFDLADWVEYIPLRIISEVSCQDVYVEGMV